MRARPLCGAAKRASVAHTSMLGLRPHVRPRRGGRRVHLQHAVGARATGESTLSDPSPARSPPEAEPKQLRTAWRLRRRYRRGQRLAALLGTALALGVVAAVVTRLPDRSVALARGFVVPSAALALLCASLPWLT